MKIKPLKWAKCTFGDGTTAEIAAGIYYEGYTVHKTGDKFYVRAGDWDTLFDTLEEAKRAVQADYERYVMSLFEDQGNE